MSNAAYLDNKSLEKAIVEYKFLNNLKCKYDLILEDIETSIKNYKNKNFSCFNIDRNEYNKLNVEIIKMKEKLAGYFAILSENILKFKKFKHVDFDDAIQEFVMICFEKMERFNPNYVGKNGLKAKAFNYMTTCILNHYRQLYRTARNYNDFKNKYKDHLDSISTEYKSVKKRKPLNRNQ